MIETDQAVEAFLRQTLAEEFSSIYVLNLRGNARTAGEQRMIARAIKRARFVGLLPFTSGTL